MNKTPIFTVMSNGLLPSKNRIADLDNWWSDNPRRYDGPPSRAAVYDYLEKALIKWPYLHKVPDSVGNYTFELAEVPVIRIYCRHDEKYNTLPYEQPDPKYRGDGSPDNPYVCISDAYKHAVCILTATCCRVQLFITPDSGRISYWRMVNVNLYVNVDDAARLMIGSTDGETYFTFTGDDPAHDYDAAVGGWTQCQYILNSSRQHMAYVGVSYRARISFLGEFDAWTPYAVGGEYIESEFFDYDVRDRDYNGSSSRTVLYGCTLRFTDKHDHIGEINLGYNTEASICKCSIYSEKARSASYGVDTLLPRGRITAAYIHDTTVTNMYVDAQYMANSNIISIGNIAAGEHSFGPIALVSDLCDSCNIEVEVTIFPNGYWDTGMYVPKNDCTALALRVKKAVRYTTATCMLTISRLGNQWESLSGGWLSCGIAERKTDGLYKCVFDCHTGTYKFTEYAADPKPLSCDAI